MKTNKKIERIALLAHPKIKASLKEAEKAVAYLKSKGLKADRGMINNKTLRKNIIAQEYDLVITLGGDGTVLRAGHLCAPYNIPIMAINMGRFGFLIEVSKDDWEDALDKVLNGDYWVEERMMLKITLWRGQKCLNEWDVLNEVVIGRGRSVRPAHLAVRLDSQLLTTFVADAVIASTPTGSTAYALAAGGPILPPELRNILLVPVAPHLSIDRAIVLSEGAVINIEILSDHEAVVSADGQQPVDLNQGDRIEIRAGQQNVSFIRFQEADYFYRNLISLMDQNPSAGDIQ